MTEEIRVVVLKDDNVFVAQCLEVDVAAQGTTPELAISRLRSALSAELKAAHDNGKQLADLGRAPESFWAVFESEVIERTALVA